MKKLRHRKGYYKGCYDDIHNKLWMVGETLTLKEVLDGWWNSVRVNRNICYKNAYTCDVDYELGELPREALKRLVLVESQDYDSDNFPICYAKFVEE